MIHDAHAYIRKAAVLGAGVMGAQIAAHLANADVQVILFDLPAKEGSKNGIVIKSLQHLSKLHPAPFASSSKVDAITPANYEDHLPLLKECDLIVEAVAERLDIKERLYQSVSPFVSESAIFASNTSGISIETLSQSVASQLRPRFCGVHFFNPPRYMKLVEIIPHRHTDMAVLDQLETFLVSTLGKGVIRAKDTPNFVANRIGVFSMLSTLHHAERLGLPYNIVDQLTGPVIGRAKSATYRTIDVVGLDTLGHVIKNMQDNLAEDPWRGLFGQPKTLDLLISKGALGQKAGAGFYKKEGNEIKVFNPNTQEYQTTSGSVDTELAQILRITNVTERFSALRQCQHPQAQFLWACFRDLFHYSSYHLSNIADNARDLDLALRWGFGWQEGPFETWQKIGWQSVVQWLQEDIASKQTLSTVDLPVWAKDENRTGVHTSEGAYCPERGEFVPRSSLSVYKKQYYPDAVLCEVYEQGQTLYEDDSVRLWHLRDDIGILSFKSKLGAIGQGVLEGIQASLAVAEERCKGLVIWQSLGAYFSVGANLKEVMALLADNDYASIEAFIDQFQQTTSAVRYSMIPVVAATQGFVLGGGCELMLHCDRVVAALETYAGLVEVGVGVIPAGGGCKEMALRAAQKTSSSEPSDLIHKYFMSLGMGETGKSAYEVREKGFISDKDFIVFNPAEILDVAITQASALADSNYRPPCPSKFVVTGQEGIATIQSQLVNMREGGFISEHDYHIGCKLAEVLCGGTIEGGSRVDEQWMLNLEKQVFVELLKEPKTQARIEHMLKTGKPLRN